MPTHLPNKPRAKGIGANELNEEKPRVAEARKRHAVETIDWLALWTLSLGFCAVVLAAIVYFTENDTTGAATIMFGAAVIIGIALSVTKAPREHD